jgi:exoribonuclease-2
MGAQNLPRGARVRVKLGEMDLITLDITGTVVERLDTPVAQAGLADNADDDGEDDEVSGPIAIAVDVDEPDNTTKDNPVP